MLARVSAAIALCIAVIAAALVVLDSGGSYTITAQFADAGELVHGANVDLAGRPVGTVGAISVAADGQADVTLQIDDPNLIPLHRGTRAVITAVGFAGVDNRFVTLLPGPTSAPSLGSGATLPTSHTSSLVNFDALLNALSPSTRAALQELLAHGAALYSGSGSTYFQRMLVKLDPAMSQLALTTAQLADDRGALASLVRTAAAASTAIASRAQALRAAVKHTTQTLGAVAAEREALGGILTRAPGVLTEGDTTLADLTNAAAALTPSLKAVPAAAAPARAFLSELTPTLTDATPVLGALMHQLPSLRTGLRNLTGLAPPTIRSLNATAPALRAAMPILAGMREYGPDFLLGIINGLAGLSSGSYDAVGHYIRVSFVQSFQTLLGGAFGNTFGGLLSHLAPGLIRLRTHVYAICPGGNEPPAADGSSPWIPSKSICNPADNIPTSVNQP